MLVHPSNLNLYKAGVTVLAPEKSLTQHNRSFETYAGQIVKETGEKWVLKLFIALPDPYHAERAFLGEMPYPDRHCMADVEAKETRWPGLERGLEAAASAKVRPTDLW